MRYPPSRGAGEFRCRRVARIAMAAEGLECPICLTLPEGEVHQCNEGHCYCVRCWDRLSEPRRCPECRQPVPQANRNRAAERAIAALAWSCEHCGVATTRGAKAAHLAACPQVPTACAAAAVGCGLAGVMSEQEAHEAACPSAICQDDSEDEDEEDEEVDADEVDTDEAGAEGHGEVDAQELTAWAEEHGMTADDAAAVFDMMGTNGDGKVTPIWMFAHYRQTSG